MGLVIGYLIKNNEDYECRVSLKRLIFRISLTSLSPSDPRISSNTGLQEHRDCPGENVELYEDDFDWNCQQQQGDQGWYNEFQRDLTASNFPCSGN